MLRMHEQAARDRRRRASVPLQRQPSMCERRAKSETSRENRSRFAVEMCIT
jgi:hypothetical protein